MQITYEEFYDYKDTLHVNVTCHISEMQPMIGDMVQWGGVCGGQQGLTCSLIPRAADIDGEEATCTVTNAVNNGRSLQASVAILLRGKGRIYH